MVDLARGGDIPHVLHGVQTDYKRLYYSDHMAALRVPVTLQAGSSAVKRVFVMSGVDGTILGEVNAPKISNRSDVSFTFSVGASIENYLYIEKTDRSPCVYRVTYTAA